jgi:glycosyltransferase involved in cell wall biosynthesis
MKCHFVYSVPEIAQQSLVLRVAKKIRKKMNDYGFPFGLISKRQPTSSDFKSWPVHSPFENTRNIYMALSSKVPTLLYHLTERIHCKFQPDDIFLGHPFFPHADNGYGVTEFSLQGKFRPQKVALISPLHCDVTIGTTHINKAFLDDVDKLMPNADVLFAIMGEYWWDQWDVSPYSHWKPKMVRLDMAVDTQHYPKIKKSFNPAGKRGYLYIGNSADPRKGTDFLSALMEKMGDFPKGWIGAGPDIPHIPRIATFSSLTPEFMTSIAQEYDFFISPAKADPNPTTILESMAWGFPVVCTPQSGYYEKSYIKNIFLDDIDKSVGVLRNLQYADEQELLEMSDTAREIVATEYSWEKFTSIVIDNLGL